MNSFKVHKIDKYGELVVFENETLLKKIFSSRFSYGFDSLKIYRRCCDYVYHNYLRDLLEKYGIDDITEFLISRAGEAMKISPYKKECINFKRELIDGEFIANASEIDSVINCKSKVIIFSDICSASGSTMKKFMKLLDDNSNLELVVFNLNIASEKSFNVISDEISEINNWIKIPNGLGEFNYQFLCWGGLFNLPPDDSEFDIGFTKIPKDTIIYLDSEKHFSVSDESEKIYRDIFMGDGDIYLDIVGEAGDKIQNDKKSIIKSFIYDLAEFLSSGILEKGRSKFNWSEKIKEAYEKLEID